MEPSLLIDYGTPRANVPPCTQIRSTLLSASIAALKEHGHYETYLERLPEEVHEPLLYTPAGVWLPVEVGHAHYTACDELSLTDAQTLSMGDRVGALTQRSVLATVMKMARSGGASPMHILKQTPRLWQRFYVGSAVALYQLGPKDAELRIVGNQLAGIRYWRVALRGLLAGICQALARTAFARESAGAQSRDFLTAYRFAWV